MNRKLVWGRGRRLIDKVDGAIIIPTSDGGDLNEMPRQSSVSQVTNKSLAAHLVFKQKSPIYHSDVDGTQHSQATISWERVHIQRRLQLTSRQKALMFPEFPESFRIA